MKLFQLLLSFLVIAAIVVIFLVVTGKIEPIESPFGGCNVHPGECGER